MVTKIKCPCVMETSQDPNKSVELAEPTCKYCSGTGELPVDVTDSGLGWVATVPGFEEDGLQGLGKTRKQAIHSLLCAIDEESAE